MDLSDFKVPVFLKKSFGSEFRTDFAPVALDTDVLGVDFGGEG